MAAPEALCIVAISDTHGMHERIVIPPGDVFVHAGDFSREGTLAEAAAFGVWVRELPHRHKLIVAGNHDLCFEDNPDRARLALGDGDGLHYLQDSGLIIEGIEFWGSPWQPEFMEWAFNLPRGPRLAERWARIPLTTDVLITHGPPSGILDVARGEHVGCVDLHHRIQELQIKVHIFGHIHGSSGINKSEGITFINASILDDDYIVSNPPRFVDVDSVQSLTARAEALIGHEVSIRWRASAFNDAAELGEGGFDRGVFTLHAFANSVLTLVSGPSHKDIRIADVVDLSETDLIVCEICAESTGPLMERPRPAAGTGTVFRDEDQRYAESRELEDGWVLHWYTTGPDDFLAFCPYHANGLEVPRAQGSIDIGDVTVDLQEFDYVLDRPNITHFKHISTRRYLNLRLENDRVTAGELLNGRWVSYPVAEGFARARSDELRGAPLAAGTRVFTADGPGTIVRPKLDPQFWVVAYDSGGEDVVSETDMISVLGEPSSTKTPDVDG